MLNKILWVLCLTGLWISCAEPKPSDEKSNQEGNADLSDVLSQNQSKDDENVAAKNSGEQTDEVSILLAEDDINLIMGKIFKIAITPVEAQGEDQSADCGSALSQEGSIKDRVLRFIAGLAEGCVYELKVVVGESKDDGSFEALFAMKTRIEQNEVEKTVDFEPRHHQRHHRLKARLHKQRLKKHRQPPRQGEIVEDDLNGLDSWLSPDDLSKKDQEKHHDRLIPLLPDDEIIPVSPPTTDSSGCTREQMNRGCPW